MVPVGGALAIAPELHTKIGAGVQKIYINTINRVYLHEYILTVADIFEALPNEISNPIQ